MRRLARTLRLVLAVFLVQLLLATLGPVAVDTFVTLGDPMNQRSSQPAATVDTPPVPAPEPVGVTPQAE